jgi:methylated-DNA-protein-cysteine methyltransferase-like protein
VTTAAHLPTRAGRIIDRVRAIPKGYVRTYGDIDPRAPRLVGRILSQTHDLPWHRVVRADGTLPQGEAQRKLLAAEDARYSAIESTLKRPASRRSRELPPSL